jgi:hypothetical protein
LHCANGPKLVGLLRTGRATWAGGPSQRRQGRALGHGSAGGGLARFRWRPATRCSGEGSGSKAVGWWTHFGATGRKKLTGRMSSTVRCGRSEGNGGGGRRPGWWSVAHGAGRSYSAVRCPGCGRGGRRGAGAGCPWRLSEGE